MDGWIKLHRKISENPMYLSEVFTRGQAWIDLLIMANHKENYFYVRGNKVIVKCGQIGLSKENLAVRWRWSRGKVIRFLNELEKEQMIVQQKSNVTSLISICKYDEYQLNDTTDSTVNDTTNGQQIVQQTVHQIVHKQEYNILSNKLDRVENDFSTAPSQQKVDYKKIVDMYHFYCPSLPKMIKLTDIRKRKIECRFKEMNSDYSVFEKIFRKMENSKFMRGDNDRGWKATLEWVISNSENWIKILEGKYDNNATEKNHKPENVNDLWK